MVTGINDKMNIGIVEENFYPADVAIRTTKMAKTLNKKGHKVFILSKNVKEGKLRDKSEDAIIYRFSYFSSTKLRDILGYPLPFNIFWLVWVLSMIAKERINALIVRNLRLAIPVAIAAKTSRIPVILDLSENFIGMAKLAKLKKRKVIHCLTYWLIRNPFLISILEKVSIGLVDLVSVVVQEQKERLLNLRIKKPVQIVSNIPILDKSTMNEQKVEVKRKFILLYIGLLNRGRGLELILNAIPYIKQKDKNIKLIIAGAGNCKTELEDITRKLCIEDIVTFTGWVRAKQVPDLIKSSDIGLIPHEINEHTQTTIPNKLFDYMRYRIPVLATKMKPIKRVIEEEQCGVIIPNNPAKVADIILNLKAHPEDLKKMGHNGKMAVLTKYNWENDFIHILDFLECRYPPCGLSR